MTRTGRSWTSSGSAPPSVSERALAIASMPCSAAGVVLVIVGVGFQLGRLVAASALLGLALFAAWYALTRTGVRRALGAAVGVAAVVAIVVVTGPNERSHAPVAVAGLVLVVVGGALARRALRRDVRTLKAEPTPGTPVPAASRPVLLVNPRSGDGKAERFGLVEACRERGIEPVVLEKGADLRALARAEIDRGADAIGMAGGDGSQAIVASVAAEADVPMVVVPAGTRNHLAVDLGLDRDDVVGALDAFGPAAERRIDLGDVNGRPFVNNVSLGVYASIVRSPEYREAKVDTTLSTLPDVLGPDSETFDLTFVAPDGSTHRGAQLIQVSNNPYGRGALVAASRPRLDTHRLGVIAVELDGDLGVGRLLAAVAAGDPERYPGFRAWTPTTFEVSSGSPIDAGVDGEASTLEAPARFSIRAGAVRMRVPPNAIGRSPAARALTPRSAAAGLWRVALGRPPVSSERP